jgi:hypothetical protein
MHKDLRKKEPRHLWAGPKTLGASEPPAYGQTSAWQARKGAADEYTASGKGNRFFHLANLAGRPSNRPRCLRHVTLTMRST